jgi:hypothetical protein
MRVLATISLSLLEKIALRDAGAAAVDWPDRNLRNSVLVAFRGTKISGRLFSPEGSIRTRRNL